MTSITFFYNLELQIGIDNIVLRPLQTLDNINFSSKSSEQLTKN